VGAFINIFREMSLNNPPNYVTFEASKEWEPQVRTDQRIHIDISICDDNEKVCMVTEHWFKYANQAQKTKNHLFELFSDLCDTSEGGAKYESHFERIEIKKDGEPQTDLFWVNTNDQSRLNKIEEDGRLCFRDSIDISAQTEFYIKVYREYQYKDRLVWEFQQRSYDDVQVRITNNTEDKVDSASSYIRFRARHSGKRKILACNCNDVNPTNGKLKKTVSNIFFCSFIVPGQGFELSWNLNKKTTPPVLPTDSLCADESLEGQR